MLNDEMTLNDLNDEMTPMTPHDEMTPNVALQIFRTFPEPEISTSRSGLPR